MTTFLAIDTATAVGSVALGSAGRVLAEERVAPRQGAGGLLPAIRRCLSSADIEYAALDAILVADGPGSFTGLRVGFATVAGLVAGCPIPVRVVSSLVSTAWGVGADPGVGGEEVESGPERVVVAMYDALRGEVFATRCRVSRHACEIIHPPRRATVADMMADGAPPDVVASADAGLLVGVGPAWSGVTVVESPEVVRAAHLLGLAAVSGGASLRAVDPPFFPDYGRQAEAQVRWEREHGRAISDSTGHRR